GGTMDLGSGIVLTDLNRDGKKEIVASTRNHELIAFDAGGSVIWRVETGAQIRSIPAIGDVDGDGEDEILIGSADWLLYCIDPRGSVEWTVNTGNRIDASPLLIDLDGDGVKDIVLPVRGGKILAFSAMPSYE
ncbi:MAG: PQQ-binding-like beta-propeller repeat protein, partial [bacterium]